MAEYTTTLKNRDGDNIYPIAGGILNDVLGTSAFIDSAVTTSKIPNNGITTDKIANLGVGTADIANLGVTTAKIPDLGIATGDIANSAVTTAKIPDLGIATANLADGAATGAKRKPTVSNLTSTIVKVSDSSSANITWEQIDLGGGIVIYLSYIGNAPTTPNGAYTEYRINYPAALTTLYAFSVMAHGDSTPHSEVCYTWANTSLIDTYLWQYGGATVRGQFFVMVIGKK